MFKKLFIYLLAVLVAVSPLQAQAEDLGSMFSNLMGPGSASTSSSGGRYTSGARNIFVGGGVEMRFPRTSVTLFSVAPPSFSAGCQGISAHFGGFSFISGKEIEDLVRNIAQGAPGLVINLVIKTLCPMCEAVLQNMQKLAQFAAKANMDSCRVAGNLVTMLGKKVLPASSSGSQAVAGECGLRESGVNKNSEWGKANSTVCSTLKGSVDALEKQWKELESGMYGASGDTAGADKVKQDVKAEKCKTGIGNCTWMVLQELFPDGGTPTPAINKNRLLVMNLMGATLTGKGVSCGAVNAEASKEVATLMCLAKLSPRDAVGLFMCGIPAGAPAAPSAPAAPGAPAVNPDRVWTEYCQNMFLTANEAGVLVPRPQAGVADAIRAMKVLDCAMLPSESGAAETSTGLDAYKDCKTLKESTVDATKLIEGPGFLYQVQGLLTEAVRRVRFNVPMGGDEKGRQIIALINAAPYPLYQAINAAAVYPDAGQTLMDSMTLLVADHIAYAYFQRLLQRSGTIGDKGLTISPEMVNKVLDGMHSLRMEADKNRSRMGKAIASQQMLMEEIRKVNIMIQQTVMTEEMLNMQKYANTVNTSTLEPSTSGK
jgi:hypothetical protein